MGKFTNQPNHALYLAYFLVFFYFNMPLLIIFALSFSGYLRQIMQPAQNDVVN